MTTIDSWTLPLLTLRGFWRRFAGAPLTARILGLVVVLGGLALLGQGMATLAAGDLGAAAGARATVRDRVFWLSAFQALILGYTTFEVIFRAPDAGLLAPLPLPPRLRLGGLLGTSMVIHLPLLIPALLYAAALARAPGGSGQIAAYAALVPTATWLFGVPVCTWLHLAGARTMLRDPGALRRLLGGEVVVADAALLLYSPAAGLGVTLVHHVATELFAQEGAFGTRSDLALLPIAWTVLPAIWAAARALRIAEEDWYGVTARFAEAEIPPPYREDGLPARTPGQELAGLLPARIRPYFLRDLRQLRRRYRLDRILLLAFALVLLRLNLADEGGFDPVVGNLGALALFVGLLITTAFRARGRELSATALSATLPIEPRAAAAGRIAVGAIHPLGALLLATIAGSLSGGPGAAALVLGGGLFLVLVLVGGSHWLAAATGRDRIAFAAVVWRAMVVAAFGGILWLMP